MSTEAVHQVGGFFPQGTKVKAYPRLSDEFGGAGSPHAEATVDKNTEVHLKGLVDNGTYWLVGEVETEEPYVDADGKSRTRTVKETKALAFTAHDEETRALSPDEAATQAATRRVTEKVAEGMTQVRADDPALAAEPAYSPPERHISQHELPEAAETDTPQVNAEREQSEARQAQRGEDEHGDRVSGPVPKEATSSDGEESRSTARTVHGARSTSRSRPTRSGTSSRPRKSATRKSPAKGRTKK